MNATAQDAIIVGGGHNGLVCAAYLAKAGLNVLVLERRDVLGGACVTEELFPGHRFSACSYYCHLLQTKVIEDLALRRHGFHVYHLDPQMFYPFPDGRGLLMWDAVERTQDAIGQFSKRDASAYPKWVAFWERAARLIQPYLLTPPPTLAELGAKVRGTPDEGFLDLLVSASMKDIVIGFFENEAVRGALVYAQDSGDPASPGSAWVRAYMSCETLNPPENVGIVKGGMGAITQAMAAAARSFGATVDTGITVERILVEQGRAIGVRLADGTEIRSRLVVSNADPKRTFLKLIDRKHLTSDFVESVERLKTNAASLKFHAALNRLPDFSRYFNGDYDPRYVAFVRMCPSVEYFEQTWDDAKRGQPAKRPVLHVQIPSGYDSTMAPEGKHSMSVWATYAPVRLKEGTWETRREEIGGRLIDLLVEYVPDFRDCLIDWELFTPFDMEQRLGLTNGNIRHLDIVPSQFLGNRPLPGWTHYRTPIGGLYLCGAGVHPGGEVTGAPGHNAAQAILTDGSPRG
ncbi:MAG TPA: NAD(P)/FAD-dependent oxidoreductase [bacterium]|nr:NAD(P)/FAD-dependent oxidoreductase [bacterium]